MHTGIGIFEWIFWAIAIIFLVLALMRSEKVSSASGLGARLQSVSLLFLWGVGLLAAIAGFITAVIDNRMNAS